MERIACGRFALAPSDFWQCTLRSVYAIIEGRSEAEQDNDRAHWERVRWMVTAMLQPHLQKGKKLAPTDIAVFPWEKATQGKPDVESEEMRAKREARWAKWDAKMKKKHNGEQD